MIALRARRTAYRIASDILHPHVDAPRPSTPAVPEIPSYADAPELPPPRIPSHPATVVAAIVLWTATAVVFTVELIRHWKHL